MKKILHIIVCFLCLIPGIQIQRIQAENKSAPLYRVLVVHSYTDKLKAYSKFSQIVVDFLKKEDIQCNIQTFYLNCEKYKEADENERMYHFLDSIQSWQPDIILSNDDQATYALMACNHPMGKTIPTVFSGVNFPNWALLKQHPNFTGFWDRPDYVTNIHLIEQLYGTSGILFFKNFQFIGKTAFELVKEQVQGTGIGIRKGLHNKKISDQEDVCPGDPDKSVLYTAETINMTASQLLSLFQSKPYTACLQIILDFNVLMIGRLANVPNFTVINNGFNDEKGVTGGYFTTLEIQAEKAAEVASRILKGTSPDQIPIIQSPKVYAFDWLEMERFNIHISDLPKDSVIYNLPLYIRYRIEILIAISLFILILFYMICHLTFMYRREARRKKQAQLNLINEKTFLKLALEGGNTYAWRLEYGEFIFENDFFTANRMIPHKMSLADLLAVTHPEDQENLEKHIHEIYSDARNHSTLQCRFNFNEKEYRWWEFRHNYREDQKKTLDTRDTIIGLCLNIQTFKDKEEKLKILQEKAEEANSMKSAFLANMSHEIRTPLNAIVGFSNILQEDDSLSDEEKVLFKETINKNCSLLLKLINDILELSRIESGRMSFTFETCRLNDLLEEIYQTHRLLIPSKLEFIKKIPDLPIDVFVDRHRFIQVITNFINNAVKFTQKGYILLAYECSEEDMMVSVYIEDTGIGMSDEAQKKVFDRFYKQDEFAQGTGLGLPICKTIAERLDGDVLLFSEEGKGSRFVLKIPYTVVGLS